MKIDIDIYINLISGLLDKHIGIVFLTLWLIFVVVSQKQQWENLNDSWKVFWIALGLFCLASSITAFYGFFLAPTANDEIDVYNLHRNLAILFFGIFGGCLAIWARLHHENQIELSRFIDRNDRFAKASEMLASDNSPVSHRGALYMLQDLIIENPAKEYIRCVEIIAEWLSKSENNVLLRQIAVFIFSIEKMKNLSAKTRDKIIEKHKKEYGITFWPSFQDANFEGVGLANLNLQGADLIGANFKNAILTGTKLKDAIIADAKMEEAIGLTEGQILETTWVLGSFNIAPPKFSEELMQKPKVQAWLKKPPFLYEHNIVER